jgi:hypothetical protein
MGSAPPEEEDGVRVLVILSDDEDGAGGVIMVLDEVSEDEVKGEVRILVVLSAVFGLTLYLDR